MVASNYTICDMKNNTKESKLYSLFKHSPNGKGIIAPVEYIRMVTSIAKDKKIQYERHTISIKTSFINYMKWRKVMPPVVFEEFPMAYIFCYCFSFCYHCQSVKGKM